MEITKTIKRFFVKSLNAISGTFISLTNTDSDLISLLGSGYRFGTNSKDFLLEAYGMNPYAFMVIDRICTRFVQLDKRLLGRRGEEIEDLNFLELLKNPNDKENGDAFLYRASATYLATGECFIIRQQAVGEEDQYFVPINYNVTINQDSKGNVVNYWVSRFGHAETYLPNEVLHISKPDVTLDTNHGFSTLRAIRKVWESNNEVWASEASLHKNKGIAGVLYSDGNRPMTDNERNLLQESYDKEYTGVESFGKVRVTTAKLNYIRMGMNPSDLKSIETRIEHLRTQCAAYNVDSKLFGDSASSTYNNMAEAKVAFIVDAVLPLAELLLPQIIAFMSKSLFQNYSMGVDEDAIPELQKIKDDRSARLGREVVQGIVSAAQARRILYPELVEEMESDPQPTVRDNVSVQDILDIQASIIRNEISRAGAVVMLMQIYGLDEDTANQILV